MKPKEIQDLIDFIAQTGLDEVNIETENFKLSVKKNSNTPKAIAEAPVPQIIMPASQPVSVPTPQVTADVQAPKTTSPAGDTSKYLTIKSPMIGTFYRTPSPDAPFFVNVGDTVSPGKPICIIEAMKLFNEIESEVSGKIVKVLVENASPVEYDQPLFLVDPS